MVRWLRRAQAVIPVQLQRRVGMARMEARALVAVAATMLEASSRLPKKSPSEKVEPSKAKQRNLKVEGWLVIEREDLRRPRWLSVSYISRHGLSNPHLTSQRCKNPIP